MSTINSSGRLTTAQSGPFSKALIESAAASLIAFLAGLPILGLHLGHTAEGLVIEPRWKVLAIAVVAVFFGRLALAAAGHGIRLLPKSVAQINHERAHRSSVWLGAVIAAAAVLLPLLPFADRYVIDLV